jgi:hypothetical protein
VTQLRKMMLEELQRRNYSQTTTRSYLKIVAGFAKHFHLPPDRVGSDQIRSYQVYLLQERKLGVRTVGHYTAALRFFFCKTLKRAYPIEEVPYPKTPRRLPTIRTREEAVQLIDSASNLFHRAMLMTIYSTGMRRCGKLAGKQHSAPASIKPWCRTCCVIASQPIWSTAARICRLCSYYSGIPTSSPLPFTCTCLSDMSGQRARRWTTWNCRAWIT